AAHTAVTDEAVDATCTTDGKTEGSHCSACGYVITPQQTIPASHTWGKWTLQADGKTVKRICTVDDSHTESKALAITLDKLSYVYSGGENKPAVTVKANGAALTPGTDYAVSYKDNVNKGTATVTVTGKGDYAGSVDKTFTVTAKSLTATAAAATNRAYDGTAAVTVTAVTLDGVVGRDDVAVNTTGLKGTVSSPNASGTPYEMVSLNGLTLTGDKAGNYALAQVNVTLPTSVTISRAAPPTATAVSRNITNKLEKEYTFALANLLPQLNEEGITENRKDWGAPVYTIRSVSLPDGYYDGVNAPARIVREDDAAILHLPIRFNDVETTGEVGAVTVEIQSANYETFTNVLSIKANNKTSVQFEGISIASRTYNGQPIAHTGTLVVKTDAGADVTANIPEPHIEITYMGVDGTAYGGDRSKVPPTNAGSFVMVIRVADEDENYIGVTQFPFAISKAPGTGSVTMADFTCGGEPSVPVSASDTNGVDGVSYVYKVRGAADETYSTTKPTSPGTYTVRASFPAATNYQAVTATADFTVSHAWADTWSTDENGHWHECTACREKKDTAEHVYGSDRDLICAACGYDRTVTENQIKGEVEVNLGTGTPAVTTDTEILKDLAGEIQKWQKVIVKLTVEKQDEPADKDEITELVTGRKDDVLYLNLSLLRQINAEEPEAITDTGSRVLEIVVPYDFTGKKDVTVYRKHGNTPAVALTRLAERPDGAFTDGTFCTDTANGKVYIYTSKFSTYAIGYTAQTSASGSSGGSTIYYTLTATAGQGGSISPSGKVSLHRNGTKAFTITPDEGCLVADVLVDGKSVGPVMEYTFERITANHTIEVVFRKITSGAADCARDNTCLISKFPDAEPEAWYHDGVHYCLEQGLMVGTSETTFAPAMETSRAMIATIFWRLSGSPEAGAEMSFPDCEAGSWYAQAVAWCAEAGVVKGYDSGNFGSDDPITREQMALMLWRYAQLRGQDVSTGGEAGLLTYSDFDQAGAWAVSALRWAVGSGVMNGKDGNRLDPKGLVSRAEAAAVLQRFFEM
ncbi:MAG: S-layer homology domain-containing protein, partial [Oscillospiraceae bacterium]